MKCNFVFHLKHLCSFIKFQKNACLCSIQYLNMMGGIQPSLTQNRPTEMNDPVFVMFINFNGSTRSKPWLNTTHSSVQWLN